MIKKYLHLIFSIIAILVLIGSVGIVVYENITSHLIEKKMYMYPQYLFNNIDRVLLIATIIGCIGAILFATLIVFKFKNKKTFIKISICVGYTISVACVLIFGLLLSIFINYNSHTNDLHDYLEIDKYIDDSEIAEFFPSSEDISELATHEEVEVKYLYTSTLPLLVEKSEFEISLLIDYSDYYEFEKAKNDLINSHYDNVDTNDKVLITIKDETCMEDGIPLISCYFIEIDNSNFSILFFAEQKYDTGTKTGDGSLS